jgi:ceramide glucosyltransferase
LNPETEILVCCDSTNAADPRWLERLTEPIRSGRSEVVTTFRSFDPCPATIGGVCQAIYAAFLLLLAVNRPTPWGGATAIRRETFERLRVTHAWSDTVVDDLILGNVLADAGVRVVMDPTALLRSPVHSQTVRGFLGYLDRQVLFPKFTNPAMWVQASSMYLNLTLAIVASLMAVAGMMMGWVEPLMGWSCATFLCSVVIFVCVLRGMNSRSIARRRWLAAFVPCIFLTAFIFARSLFRNHIDWHGKRYWPGKAGIVIRVESLNTH